MKRRRDQLKAPFADFGIRIAALSVDLILLSVGSAHLIDVALAPLGIDVADHRPVVLLLGCGYFAVCWSSPWRATLGQLLLGISVVGLDCERLPWHRAALRSLALMATVAGAFLPLVQPGTYFALTGTFAYAAIFLAAITANRQAGHDLFAGTMVTNRAALRSPEHNHRLREHVASQSQERPFARPSIISMVRNFLVLAVPTFLLMGAGDVMRAKDLSFRTAYAMSEVSDLQWAIEEHYLQRGQLPSSKDRLGVATFARYPAGGYYELLDGGAIRIQFEVKRELKDGWLTLQPAINDGSISWACQAHGNIELRYLPTRCRTS